MKRTILLFTVLILQGFISNAQVPNWQWAISGIGKSNDMAKCVAVDASGNSYVVGSFTSDTIILGSYSLYNTNTNNAADIFIAKFDLDGNVLWAKTPIVPTNNQDPSEAFGVAVDNSGNVVVVGYFTCTSINFNGILLSCSSYPYSDIFLVKYDANGSVIWAKQAGGTQNDKATGITVDSYGNIYVVGNFTSPNLTFGSNPLTNTYSLAPTSYDIFLTKYDNNGNNLWAKSAGSAVNSYVNTPTSVSLDASGNAYVTGNFQVTIDFGSSNVLTCSNTTYGTQAAFLAKYDFDGNILWARCPSNYAGSFSSSVKVNNAGYAYITGYYYSPTLIFGGTTLTNVGGANVADIFLVKYDDSGNVIWAKNAGSADDDFGKSIVIDGSDNIILVGYFDSGTITFGSYALTNSYSGGGSSDIFLAKYNDAGTVLWAEKAGGTSNGDMAQSVAKDNLDNIILVGNFNSHPLNFDLNTLTNNGVSNVFIAKTGNIYTGSNELINPVELSIYPNPASNVIHINTNAKSFIDIINIEGQTIKSVSNNEGSTTIDVSNFINGMYFIKIKSNEEMIIKKFIKY